MKFLISVLGAALISTPAFAQHYNHNHRPQHHHHYHQRNNNWVGPAILGAIGTAIILDQYGRQRQVVVEQPPQVVISSTPPVIVHNPPVVTVPSVTLNCTAWREIIESNGRTYRERTCTEIPN